MNRKLKLYAGTLVVLFAALACEQNEMELMPDDAELKSANNGMIKSYSSDMVLAWNTLLSSAIDQKMPQPAEANIYVKYSLAVHDALNNIVPKYETYALDNSKLNYKDVSKKNIYSLADAAVAQAAHDVIIVLVPGLTAAANNLLSTSLSSIEESEYKARGIQTGMDAAAAIIAKRADDIWFGFASYPVGTLPGDYRPTVPWMFANPNPPYWPANSVYGATLGDLVPYGINTAGQFRAVPPIAQNSDQYLADYNEVKSLGGDLSIDRTAEQTETGIFCIDNVCNSMNRVNRYFAVEENLDGWETARLMALTQMAVMDAYISSFEGKYHYNRWRPMTAIQNGDTDGIDGTAGDPAWISLAAAGFTPPTPTYPSTHAECGGAATEVLKLFFKKDNKPFTIGCYGLPDITRTYNSFSEFSKDLALSRIYIGYHFRNDIEQGEKMGKELGNFVFKNNLREMKTQPHHKVCK